jgi:hypothetical protein
MLKLPKIATLTSSFFALVTHNSLMATPNLSFDDDASPTQLKRTASSSEQSDNDPKRLRTKPASALRSPKQDAIDKIKDAIRQAENGDAEWAQVMSMQKTLCRQYGISLRDLGIELKQGVDFRKIGSLPIADRLKAMREVPNEFRCNVPITIRREILAYELEQIADPTRRDQLQTLIEAELALKVVFFTPSQEEARDVKIPEIEGQLSPIKKRSMELIRVIEQLEKDQKKLEADKAERESKLKTSKPETKKFELKLETDSSEDEDSSVAFMTEKLAMIRDRIAELKQTLAKLDQERLEINRKAQPHINKIMRDFQAPRK